MRNMIYIPSRSLGRRKSTLPKSKNLLLETTKASILQKGLAKTTVREIARKTGTSATMVYYHFGGKEGIVCAAANLACNELLNELSNSWESPPSTTRESNQNDIASILYQGLYQNSFLGRLTIDPIVTKFRQLTNLLLEINIEIYGALHDIAFKNEKAGNHIDYSEIERNLNYIFIVPGFHNCQQDDEPDSTLDEHPYRIQPSA